MKSNRVFIGIILVMIGVYSLLRTHVSFDFSALTMTVIGLSFLLLYRQKKAVWALFVGGYVFFMGASGLLNWAGFRSDPRMLVGMFFIVPGAIFLVLYFDKHRHGLLIPGTILLWLGVGLVLANIFRLDVRASISLMIACVGLSFCTAYMIGRSYMGRGLLNLGIIITAAGTLLASGLVPGGFSRFVPYALIAVGATIVIGSILYKPRQ